MSRVPSDFCKGCEVPVSMRDGYCRFDTKPRMAMTTSQAEAAMKKIIDADPDRDTLLRARLKKGANSQSESDLRDKKTETTALKGLSRISAALSDLKDKK